MLKISTICVGLRENLLVVICSEHLKLFGITKLETPSQEIVHFWFIENKRVKKYNKDLERRMSFLETN